MNEKIEFIKEVVKTDERYKNFTLYDEPIPFKDTELFSEKYDCIQIHDTSYVAKRTTGDATRIRNTICGFAGQCKVENDRVIALDGDSYTKNMTVLGYSEFEIKDGGQGLDLLVDEW